MPHLTDLPYDCINEILEYVHQYRQVCRVACTCWYLHEQAQEEILWEQLCRVHLPRDVYENAKRGVETRTAFRTFVSWQRLLRQQSRNKKMNTLVSFITQGGEIERGTSTFNKTDELMRKLIDISFSDGGCIGPTGAMNLARVLDRNMNVETLDLTGQLIRDNGMADLLSTLPTCASLSGLSLAENRLTARSTQCIASLIGTVKQLDTLDISQNPGLPISAVSAALIERKANGLGPIQKLHLDGLPSCSKASDVKFLLESFLEGQHLDSGAKNTSMRVLTLRSGSMENKAFKHLCEFIVNWNAKVGCGTRVVEKACPTTGRPEKVESVPTLLLDISDIPHSNEKSHNQLPGKGEQVDILHKSNAGGKAVHLVFTAKDSAGGCLCM